MFMCDIRHLFPFSPLSSMAKKKLIRLSKNIIYIYFFFFFFFLGGGGFNTSICKK